MRTFGVEEELLLVDVGTGTPVPAAPAALAACRASGVDAGSLTAEMHQEMIEAITRPCSSAAALAEEVAAGRAAADAGARAAGARAVALAASPLPVLPHPTQSGRYARMMAAYGSIPRHSLSCGLHVHVAVDSPAEGVAVLDRLRPWLPLLVALTANSPFADGEDTGHASWRSVAWQQWPVAGPCEVFGDVTTYRALERQLLDTGVLLDAAMLYFPARLSANHPTVEVRVADVCLDARDTVVIAALLRALVDTVAADAAHGIPVPAVPATALRLATWQAALRGVQGPLVDPATGAPAPATAVVARLLATTLDALHANGDDVLVVDGLSRILRDGTGADLQRRALPRPDGLVEVVRAAVAATHGETLVDEAPAGEPRRELRASAA